MDFLDALRARLHDRQMEMGSARGAIEAGAVFALAFLDEMDQEARTATSGSTRADDQILRDALLRSEQNFASYVAAFDNEIRRISQADMRQTLESYHTDQQSWWRRWGIPLLHGVLANFVWLFACGLIVWLAFAIKADWPTAVQGWVIGGDNK